MNSNHDNSTYADNKLAAYGKYNDTKIFKINIYAKVNVFTRWEA